LRERIAFMLEGSRGPGFLLKIWTLCSFQMTGINYPLTICHSAEEWSLNHGSISGKGQEIYVLFLAPRPAVSPTLPPVQWVESSWNVMADGDAQERKWRGNWWMGWVASTLYTTSEHGVSLITIADAHTSAVSSRLNWHPHRFKWTCPFCRKTKLGFCACAITFQMQSTRGDLCGGKAAGVCLWLLTPPSAEVKNDCHHTTKPPLQYDFMVHTGMGYRAGSG